MLERLFYIVKQQNDFCRLQGERPCFIRQVMNPIMSFGQLKTLPDMVDVTSRPWLMFMSAAFRDQKSGANSLVKGKNAGLSGIANTIYIRHQKIYGCFRVGIYLGVRHNNLSTLRKSVLFMYFSG